MIANKENDDLFYIDTVGKDSVASTAKPVKKTLKIDEILKPESAYTVGRSHQTKASKTEEALIAKKVKAVSAGVATGTKKNVPKATVYDAWGDEDSNSNALESSKKSKFVPVIPAVPVPVAAISYNPSRDEHLAHLESLESQEIVRLARNEAFKERLPLTEVPADLVKSADLVAVANRKLATGEISDDDEDELKDEGSSFLSGSTQSNRKKTIQDRKRQLRHKALMSSQKKLRQEKNLLASIERVPDLLEQMQNIQQTRREVEQILAPVQEEIQQQRKLKKIKKRLVLEPLAIKLPEELPASMRQLAPEGNLVTDRFRNLVERGVVEAFNHKILSSEAKQRKNYKPRIKMVEKYSYKDFK